MFKRIPMKFAWIALACATAFSAAAHPPQRVEVPAGDIVTALNTLAKQTNVELVFQATELKGIRTDGVKGIYAPQEAVVLLLKGTKLMVHTDSSGAMFISPSESTKTSAAAAQDATVRLAQGAAQNMQQVVSSPSQGEDQGEDSGKTASVSEETEGGKVQEELQEIVVTGTHIRGANSGSSPVVSYSREEIALTGATTVQDFFRNLPQNFGGGANPENQLGISETGRESVTNSLGAGLNLRGLGSGATLTLVNGKRLATSDAYGYVDVSMIPVSAIERIEILTDGASAIYGSDAVGGVVNLILRKDFSGLETSLQAGGITEGSSNRYRVSQSVGHSWEGGHGVLAYEYQRQNKLLAADKPFSRDAPFQPYTLVPRTVKNSFFASGEQELGSNLNLSAELYYTQRKTSQQSAGSDFEGGIAKAIANPSVRQYGGTTGIKWRLQGDWQLTASMGYGKARRHGLRAIQAITSIGCMRPC